MNFSSEGVNTPFLGNTQRAEVLLTPIQSVHLDYFPPIFTWFKVSKYNAIKYNITVYNVKVMAKYGSVYKKNGSVY